MIKIIVCVDKYSSIGIDNDLIYKFKEDMKIFREKTLGNIVVMGRKTFESLGMNPLKDRENIIISKTLNKSSSYKVLRNIEDVFNITTSKDIYIIGGKEIYEYFIPYSDEIHLTIVKNNFTKKYDVNNSIKVNINLNGFIVMSSQQFNEFNINVYKRLPN